MHVSALNDARVSGNTESVQSATQEIGTLPHISQKLEAGQAGARQCKSVVTTTDYGEIEVKVITIPISDIHSPSSLTSVSVLNNFQSFS